MLSAYNNNYSAAIDGNDAIQIANFDEDISISRSGNKMSIESRPLIDVTDTINIAAARLKAQNYEWQFDVADFSHPTLQATLVDKFLSTRTPINLSGSTVVPFTVTGDAASAAEDRFMVVFGSNSVLPVKLTTIKAYKQATGIQVEWTSQTESNLDRYEVEKSANGQRFDKAASVTAKGNSNIATSYSWLDVRPMNANNYYRIKAISKTGEADYSKIVKVYVGNNGNEITIYPNPVKGNIISLSFSLDKGRYTLTLTNKLGQKVFSKVIDHAGGSATQTLQIGNTLAQGVYQLKVTGGETNIIQQLIKN